MVSSVKEIRISGKRRFSDPWMMKGIEASSCKRQLLYKETIKKGTTTETLAKYKEYQNNFNRIKRSARNKYYHEKAEEYKSNTKKLWQLINMTINKTKNSGSIISHISVNGLKLYSLRAIANEFGHYYSNMGLNLASKITPSVVTIDNYLAKIPCTVNSMYMNLTNHTEIEKTILELQSKTSCGHNNISNNLLKKLCMSISYPLEIIFNQSIPQGVFPSLMKIAEVIPPYKGKDHEEIINYRPISLLTTISKLLEKIVYKRVYSFLDHYDVLYQSQYGFCNKRSCSQAIAELTGKLLQNKEAGLHSTSVFLDLSKVFDMLDYTVLLQKLEWYGIHGISNSWFASYLQGRMLRAKVQTKPGKVTYSKNFDITCGTAHGSCLGPLLFIIILMYNTCPCMEG